MWTDGVAFLESQYQLQSSHELASSGDMRGTLGYDEELPQRHLVDQMEPNEKMIDHSSVMPYRLGWCPRDRGVR